MKRSNYQGRIWSNSEIVKLIDLHKSGIPYGQIAKILGRTPTAISMRCRMLGLVRYRRWRPEEVEEINTMRSYGLTSRQIASRLDVDVKRIKNIYKNRRGALSRSTRNGWIDKVALSEIWLEGLPVKVISRRLAERTGGKPVHVDHISRTAHEMGLPDIREVRRGLREERR